LDGVGLTAGVKAFRMRLSPLITGQAATSQMRLGGRPTKLLVPPELEANADTIYASNNLSAVKASDANIHYNKYRPVVAPELSDSSFGGGYSTTAWYLFDDVMKPIDVSFLNGQQTPTIDSADADFDQLGIQFRGYHDFGANQGEYLAGIKSKGAA
jgi:phage major head subunit gpT-like protein